ncbi:universal stress protein [Desulfohalovibrio reitneri]|uniref:universal stress protein n=1 Tax=Desulfohalovibrio reitneri TaxID=1307759 RepID=UPI0004A700A6|nr:universal stress protein [Desulfohalovibrio reitneri]
MEKHLLLTVSGDRTASYPLRFVKGFFNQFCDLRITLLYVAPRPAGGTFDPSLQPEQHALAEMEEAKRTSSHEALDYAYDWITYRACDPSKVTKKVVHSQMGTVGEIIHEAQKGMYDAVALGRRGVSWLEEMVSDSVSHKILWQKLDFPIWICRRPDELNQRKNVLLCVDETTASDRIADHVGFMLGNEEEHNITIFHVKRDNPRITTETQKIIDHTESVLIENGFPQEQLSVRVSQAKDPASAILEEAEQGRYAVVACGRNADEPSSKDRFLPSSTTTKLLRRINTTLWVSK